MSASTYVLNENNKVVLNLPGFEYLNTYDSDEFEVTYDEFFETAKELQAINDEWCQKDATRILTALRNMGEEEWCLISAE